MGMHDVERIHEYLTRYAVPGGWLYVCSFHIIHHAAVAFVPDQTAPHVREAAAVESLVDRTDAIAGLRQAGRTLATLLEELRDDVTEGSVAEADIDDALRCWARVNWRINRGGAQ